jgi:hypothetical protein
MATEIKLNVMLKIKKFHHNSHYQNSEVPSPSIHTPHLK